MAFTGAEVEVKFRSQGADKVESDIKGVGSAVDNVNNKGGGFLKGVVQGAVGFFGGELMTRGISTLGNLGKSFIMANADAETLKLGLEVATGSAEKAQTVFDSMMVMAKKSPFEFPELANSARMLETFGLSAEKWVPVIGNTSAATGKSIDEVTNAFLDAQTGEFERLKELGIRTIEEGGQTYFQYMDKNGQLVKKAIDRNNPEIINSTLEGIWNEQYGGAMDKMSNTFAGKMATLKDNISLAMQQMSKPLFDFVSKGVEAGNVFFEEFDRLREKGLSPVNAGFEALRDTVTRVIGGSAAKTINSFITKAENGFEKLLDGAGKLGSGLGKAFSFLGDHLDTILPALKGIGVAIAGMMAFSGVTAIIAGLGAALGFLLSPIMLIIGAAALLGVAWSNNWGDIQGKTAAVVSFLTGTVWPAIQSGIDAVVKGLGILKDAFEMGGISAVWDRLVEGFQSVDWGGLASRAVDLILTGLRAIGTAAPGIFQTLSTALLNALQTLGDLTLQGIQAAWDAISSLNWRDFIPDIDWGAFIDRVTDLGRWIADKISDLPWGTLVDKVTDLGSWIVEKISEMPWAEIVNKVTTLGTYIVDKIKELPWAEIIDKVTSLGSYLVDKIGDLPWAEIVDKVTNLGTYLTDKIIDFDWGSVIDKVTNLGTYLVDKITEIDWAEIVGTTVSVGQSILDEAKALLGTIDWGQVVGTVTSVGAGVLNWVKGVLGDIDWGQVVGTVVSVGAGVLNTAKTLLGSIDWGRVVGTVTSVGAGILNWVKGLLGSISWSDLFGAVIDLGASVLSWIQGQISVPEFPDWPSAGDIAAWIKNAIFSAVSNVVGGGGGGSDFVDENGDNMEDEPPMQTGKNTGGPVQMGYTPQTDFVGQIQNSGSMSPPDPGPWAAFAAVVSSAQAAVVTFVAASVSVLAGFSTAVSSAMTSSSSAVTTGVLGMQIAAASGLASMASAFTTGFLQVQIIVASSMASASSAMTTGMLQIQIAAASGMSSTVSAVTTGFLQIQVIVASAMSSTSSAVTTGFTQIQTTTASAMSSVTSAVRTGFTQIQTTVASAMSSTTSAVTSGFLQVQTTIASAMSSSTSAVRTGFSQMQSAASSGMSSLVSAVSSGMSQARGAIQSGASSWAGAISGYAGAMSAAGAAVGQAAGAGVAQGMLNTLGTVRAAASAIVAEVDRALNAAAKVASPSKLTAVVGRFLTEGVASGMLDARAFRKLASSAHEVTRSIYSAVERGIDNPSIGIGASLSGVTGNAVAPRAMSQTWGSMASVTNYEKVEIVINTQPGQSNEEIARYIFDLMNGGLRGVRP